MHHERTNTRTITNDIVTLTQNYSIVLSGSDAEVWYMRQLIKRRQAESGLTYEEELAAWVLPLFRQMKGRNYVEGRLKHTGSVMSLRLTDETTLEVSLTSK